MYQLFYNDDFTECLEERIYNKHLSQMPKSFLNFIKDKIRKMLIYNKKTNDYYCAKCFNKLTNSMYCDKCCFNYYDVKFFFEDISDINENDYLESNYYYFDVIDNNVLVYCVKRQVHFYSKEKIKYLEEMGYKANKNNSSIYYDEMIDIDWIVKIKKNQIYDLNNNHAYNHIEFNRNGLFSGYGDIYIDNLDMLKSTDLFKYKPLWNCKDYFKSPRSIRNIIYYALNNECFEYLVKFKLYALAFSKVEFKGNFEKTLGVDKSYLDFMVKYSIDDYALRALKLIKLKDIKLVRTIEKIGCIDILEKLKEKYNVNILKLVEYVNKNKMDDEKKDDYFEYIKMVFELGYDLKDKKILYPVDFYDTFETMSEIYYSQMDKDIERVGSILDINKYEDDQYIIYPPKSAKSIVDEANQQSNCLLTYLASYSKGKSQIYFMRKKDEIDESLVTIEVEDNKVVQARARFNEDPSPSLLKVVKKWEKNLISVDIS